MAIHLGYLFTVVKIQLECKFCIECKYEEHSASVQVVTSPCDIINNGWAILMKKTLLISVSTF